MDSRRLDEIARRHGIRLLLQFGSTVTGRARPESDLDLAVLLERTPASLQEHAALVDDLQRLVPDRTVDVAILNRADPLFLKQVTTPCTLLYGALRTLHEFKMYAFRRYQDHRRFLDLEQQYVTKALEHVAR
jgi:predicted nucleotidyltransferase